MNPETNNIHALSDLVIILVGDIDLVAVIIGYSDLVVILVGVTDLVVIIVGDLDLVVILIGTLHIDTSSCPSNMLAKLQCLNPLYLCAISPLKLPHLYFVI